MTKPGMIILGSLLLALGCAGPDQPNELHPAASAATASRSAAARRDGRVPNFTVQTHENKTVRFYDDLVKDKVVIINFMYTTCNGVCPAITANLMQLQEILGDRLGRDMFMISITLDPKEDTPAVLQSYAQSIGAKPGWCFVTGQDEEIQTLRRNLGAYDPDPVIDADRSQHAGIVVYGNDALDRWAAMPGLVKPDFMARTILKLARAKRDP